MNARIPTSQRLRNLMHGLLGLLFCLCWGRSVHAQAGAEAVATFKNVEALPDQTNDGLHGIAIRFELPFKAAPPVGPNAVYAVIAQVLDENAKPVFAASNASGYTDHEGYCRDSLGLVWASPDAVLGEQAMFVPYFAMGLPAGPNRAKIDLRLVDLRTKQVVATADRIDLRFQKPTMKLYRMRVDRLEAFTTDSDGETWDYKFLNARDIYPDLIWSLRRGHFDVFESPKQKNDTVYIGTPSDLSPWVWLSEGDRIHFYVRDFDLLGYSDLVGSLGIDIWQLGFLGGQVHPLKFERVRQAQVMQEAIAPPKVAIAGYEVIEQDKQAGLSGTRLKLEYVVSDAVPNARYILEPRLRTARGSFVPQVVQIIGQGAVPLAPGLIELTANRSTLELFVPHFALPDSMTSGALMLVEAGVLLDGKQGFVLSRLQRQLLGDRTPVNDMVYGQWKVGVHDIAGRGGLRISLDYELPEAYFDGLGQAQIYLVPSLTAAWGEIDNAVLEAIGEGQAAWKTGRLLLDRTNRKGSLDLFLPFAACPAGGGATQLSASYRTVLELAGRQLGIGSMQRQADVELPELQQLSLGLREASVGRTSWILNHPSMYWELLCGDKVLHRSKVVPDVRTARWSEDDAHAWVVAPSDRIEVRVYHQVTDGLPDRLLEIWTGQLSELPGRGKSNARVPTKDLKRMVLHLEYADPAKDDVRNKGQRDR